MIFIGKTLQYVTSAPSNSKTEVTLVIISDDFKDISNPTVESLEQERLKIPKRSFPILPWLELAVRRKVQKRFRWKIKLSKPILFWKLLEMPKLQEMTTHRGLENSFGFISITKANFLVAILKHTCWKSQELRFNKNWTDLTTFSTN